MLVRGGFVDGATVGVEGATVGCSDGSGIAPSMEITPPQLFEE
jgi:hypothetical protein